VSGIQHSAVRNRRTDVTKTVLCIQINIHGVTLHSLWQHNPVNNISHLRREILIILFLLLLFYCQFMRCVNFHVSRQNIFLIFLDLERNPNKQFEYVLF